MYRKWFLLSVLAAPLVTNGAPITALTFSPDGSTLVSNGPKKIDFRSPKNGGVERSIAIDVPRITSLAFHPGGHLLAVGGGTPGVSGEALILNWRDEKVLWRLTNLHDLVTRVSFHPEGTLLAAASADHSVRVWKIAPDAPTAPEAFTLTGHAGPVLAIAFTPSGRSMVTASADRSLKVWSSQDGRLLRTFSHHTEAVHALVMRPMAGNAAETSPGFCASGGDDRTVRIWQPEIGRMIRIIRQHQGPIFALTYTPDGSTLFSAGKEGIVRQLDAESDTILRTWPAQSDWIYALAASPDGSKLAAGDWSGKVQLWDLHAPAAALSAGK